MNEIFSIKKVLFAAKYSFEGILFALRNERSFRQEFYIFIGILIFSSFFCEAQTAMILLAAWLSVMAFELLNSAIEKCLDMITEEYSPVVKAAKDMASGAIFLTICLNIIIWIILFLGRHSST